MWACKWPGSRHGIDLKDLLDVYYSDGRKSHSTAVFMCQKFWGVHCREGPSDGHMGASPWSLPNILLCSLAASPLVQDPLPKSLVLFFALGTDHLSTFLGWAQGSSCVCLALGCFCDFLGGVALTGPCWFNTRGLKEGTGHIQKVGNSWSQKVFWDSWAEFWKK